MHGSQETSTSRESSYFIESFTKNRFAFQAKQQKRFKRLGDDILVACIRKGLFPK
jgi:hypothetical protein